MFLVRADFRRRFIKSDLLKSLDDNIVDETCARFMEVPDGCSKWSSTYSSTSPSSDQRLQLGCLNSPVVGLLVMSRIRVSRHHIVKRLSPSLPFINGDIMSPSKRIIDASQQLRNGSTRSFIQIPLEALCLA